MRVKKTTEDLEPQPQDLVTHLSRPKKVKPQRKAVKSSPLVTVSQLKQKAVLVATMVEGNTLYLHPPSIKFAESLHETNTNLELGAKIASYLGENLFNDVDGLKPVGTVDEFKEGFSPVELMELFQRLNDGLLLKKKAH